jgi:pyrroline-5-carboxylate reductase
VTKIALLGAGGKMGVRLSTNLKDTRFGVDHVEVSAEGRVRLKTALGIECMEQGQAISPSDAIVMAVPDRLIGKILKTFVTALRPGAKVVMLDAAAPHAGELPEREDITYFVTHPCHPTIFNDEIDPKAKTDYFGGVHAKQHVVCALMQALESHYAECEEIARQIYEPMMRAHRCTVEQLAILEPVLSETVGATFALALREATDEAVRRGVPKQAAIDFIIVTSTLSSRSRSEFFLRASSRTTPCRRSARPSWSFSVTDGSTAFFRRRLCSNRSKTFARLRPHEERSSRRRVAGIVLARLRRAGSLCFRAEIRGQGLALCR